jgi:hypothetical protein
MFEMYVFIYIIYYFFKIYIIKTNIRIKKPSTLEQPYLPKL